MPIIRFLIPFLLITMNVACIENSQGQSIHETTFSDRSPVADKSLEVRAARLGGNQYRIQCGSADCSPSVAAVLAISSITGKEAKAGACTGFLVGEDLAYTNLHCLPASLRKAGLSCGQVTLMFPAAGKHSAENVACESIVELSKDRVPEPGGNKRVENPYLEDWVLMRLERKLKRPPLRLAQSGFQNEEIYTIHAVDWSQDHSLKLVTRKCRSVYSTLMAPSFDSPYHGYAWLGGCPIQQGFSGSPVMDSRQLIVGIIKNHVSMIQQFAGNEWRVYGALAGNFACVSSAELGLRVMSFQCRADVQREKKLRSEMEAEFHNELVRKATKLQSDIYSATVKSNIVWQYELVKENGGFLLVPIPRCYMEADKISPYVSTEFKAWRLQVGMDSFGRYTSQFAEEPTPVAFDLSSFGQSMIAKIAVASGPAALSQIEVKSCRAL